jgi:hypothetical protein
MPIYPGSTTNINLYPTTPTTLNIALYPPPTPAGGIALVQSASGTTADGSAGLTVNFDVPVTAGNSVIALISCPILSEPYPSSSLQCVGGGEESLNLIVQINPDPGVAARIFSANALAGGETGVTFTPDLAVRANNIIAEYSGLADAAAEDTATNTATSTTLAIGTITPTSANNLLTAIFAFNADVTAVGIANDVLVTGIGAGVYTCRGDDGDHVFYNLLGQPTNGPNEEAIYCVYYTGGAWNVTGSDGGTLNTAITTGDTFPYDASWTGSTVTEIPGWELVGTRTGGSSVWEYVYQKIQTTATPSNPTIVLSGSADIAGAAAAFGGA